MSARGGGAVPGGFLFVIGVAGADFRGSVDLLEEYDSEELTGECGGAEGEPVSAAGEDGGREAVGAACDEEEAGAARNGVPIDVVGEVFRA